MEEQEKDSLIRTIEELEAEVEMRDARIRELSDALNKALMMECEISQD